MNTLQPPRTEPPRRPPAVESDGGDALAAVCRRFWQLTEPRGPDGSSQIRRLPPDKYNNHKTLHSTVTTAAAIGLLWAPATGLS